MGISQDALAVVPFRAAADSCGTLLTTTVCPDTLGQIISAMDADALSGSISQLELAMNRNFAGLR